MGFLLSGVSFFAKAVCSLQSFKFAPLLCSDSPLRREKAMGNSESSNPVRNMDKRTARREYKDDFAAGIARYRQQHGIVVGGKKGKNEEAVETFDESSWGKGDIRVFVRKRPIFPHELENSEFDVISCVKDKVIVHDARMHNDMKRQLINHHEFQFDYVFNERSTNEAVYQVSTKPLVQIACDGGFSTALMYGQTGSGKVRIS